MTTYEKALLLAKAFDSKNPNLFRLIGKNVNKSVFQILDDGRDSGWVLLIGSEKTIREEIENLESIAKYGIKIPELGRKEMISVEYNSTAKFAFLEEYIDGFISKNNEISTDINIFCSKLYTELVNESSKEKFPYPLTKVKYTRALDSVTILYSIFEKYPEFDIDDLQLFYQRTTGLILVTDPGTKGTAYMRDKHIEWFKAIIKELENVKRKCKF